MLSTSREHFHKASPNSNEQLYYNVATLSILQKSFIVYLFEGTMLYICCSRYEYYLWFLSPLLLISASEQLASRNHIPLLLPPSLSLTSLLTSSLNSISCGISSEQFQSVLRSYLPTSQLMTCKLWPPHKQPTLRLCDEELNFDSTFNQESVFLLNISSSSCKKTRRNGSRFVQFWQLIVSCFV